ncbi:hypothetical protein G6011_05148 [Alternaria panax]|uniref:Uncharacterized protein n=1 Tax=Alternaria panax TaxID=48097 RepID=A0AAD4FCH7_9PLEO|nr:hypothetical protein G6011_05148 [Alternaria panax]
MANPNTISEHDLSLISPSTGETPKLPSMSTPKKSQGSTDLGERTVSSALRGLAPKPFANMSGSCHNPIVVNETSSPPRRAAQASKRRPRHKKLTEPHQFIGNGYRDLYSYRASQPALAGIPANGSTFTGHQSHDIYRMMNAKIIAAPDFSPNAAWGRHTLNVPFEVQYPLSAHALTRQQNASQYQSPYAQYHRLQASPNAYGYPTVPPQNEDLLRMRAVQYIRGYSQPSLHKRWLSDADPDETSGDEAEERQRYTRPQPNILDPQSGSMPPLLTRNVDRHINHKPTIHQDPDPDFVVGHLIEHTSLITSLLQLYPHSTDQRGLKNDISMLVQVQNQHVTDWIKVESQNSRKRRKDNSGSAARLDNRPQPIMTHGTRIQKDNDNTLRQVFSANADMWQDGTGHGVADVFAVSPASSPVASSLAGMISRSTHMPSALLASGLAMPKKAGNTSSTITTPTKQILNSAPGAAHYKGMPTTPNMQDIRTEFSHPSTSSKDNAESLTRLSVPSSSSKDPATPTKATPLSINVTKTPSTSRKHYPLSAHNNRSGCSEQATTQHPDPSSDDDELHIPNRINGTSSYHSESSNDFRNRQPVFRFERRVDGVDGRAGADRLSKE